MLIQTLNIKLDNGECKNFTIDKINDKDFGLSLSDSIYAGKAPVFETAEDAFLFMLKILAWIPFEIIQISSSCEFIGKDEIKNISKINEVHVHK